MKRTEQICPFCNGEKYSLKEWKTRKIKHALFYNKETTFFVKTPRYICHCCFKTFTQVNEYAPKRARVSHETIQNVLNALMKYNETFTSIAEMYHLTPTTVQNIFDRYVNPTRKPLPKVISIDEFYNNSQFTAPYSVVIYDFLKRKVIDIVLDRKKQSLNVYLCKLTREERSNVEYVVIDMWEPYLDLAKAHFNNPVIAIDSFHVMQHLGKAMDDLRCRIIRKYNSKDINYYLLKKYGYLLRQSPRMWDEKEKNKRLKRYVNEYDLLQMILSIDPELGIAHNYYIRYKIFNENSSYESATKRYDFVTTNFDGVIINEFISVVNMFIKWKKYILNSFLIVDGNRLSNGPIEGTNSQIKKLFKVGNGFSNFHRARNRIMHCYNKELCLSPIITKIAKIKRKPRGKYKKSANL